MDHALRNYRHTYSLIISKDAVTHIYHEPVTFHYSTWNTLIYWFCPSSKLWSPETMNCSESLIQILFDLALALRFEVLEVYNLMSCIFYWFSYLLMQQAHQCHLPKSMASVAQSQSYILSLGLHDHHGDSQTTGKVYTSTGRSAIDDPLSTADTHKVELCDGSGEQPPLLKRSHFWQSTVLENKRACSFLTVVGGGGGRWWW